MNLGYGFTIDTLSGAVRANAASEVSNLCFAVVARQGTLISAPEFFHITTLSEIKALNTSLPEGYVNEFYRNPVNEAPYYLQITGGEPLPNGGYKVEFASVSNNLPPGIHLYARVGNPPATTTTEGTTALCEIYVDSNGQQNTCGSVDWNNLSGPVYWYLTDLSKARTPTTPGAFNFRLRISGKDGRLV